MCSCTNKWQLLIAGTHLMANIKVVRSINSEKVELLAKWLFDNLCVLCYLSGVTYSLNWQPVFTTQEVYQRLPALLRWLTITVPKGHVCTYTLHCI